MKVHVCDMPMGTGKSSAAITYMNANPSKRFIYVTPYLDETERIVSSCTGNFVMPSDENHATQFNKSDDILSLIRNNCNIATTHQLFTMLSDEAIEEIRGRNYTIILDEVLDTFFKSDISPSDFKILRDSGWLQVVPTSTGIEYVYDIDNAPDKYRGGKFREFFTMARCHRLCEIPTNSDEEHALYCWGLQRNLFACADEVFVLTFMFDGSVMRSYMKINNIEYDSIGVRYDELLHKYTFVSDTTLPSSFVNDLNKIHIYDNARSNLIGDKKTALSFNWYKRAAAREQDKIDRVGKNVYNFFRYARHAQASDCLWTCPIKASKYMDRYGKQFLAFNARATNKYANVHNLAYCINVFCDPDISNYMKSCGAEIDADAYALSCLIQWVWRSAIRNGEDIYLYLPSARMRNLFEEWRSKLLALSP